jgi:hypothetical protein
MSVNVLVSREQVRARIAGRLRFIRRERFGERCVPVLARELGVPERTWLDYEAGATIPGEVLLRFLDATLAEPRWLLTGQGPRYRARPGPTWRRLGRRGQ